MFCYFIYALYKFPSKESMHIPHENTVLTRSTNLILAIFWLQH